MLGVIVTESFGAMMKARRAVMASARLALESTVAPVVGSTRSIQPPSWRYQTEAR